MLVELYGIGDLGDGDPEAFGFEGAELGLRWRVSSVVGCAGCGVEAGGGCARMKELGLEFVQVGEVMAQGPMAVFDEDGRSFDN